MPAPELDVAQRAGATLGEGPTWDAAAGRLIWIDILERRVHRLDPSSGQDEVLQTSQHVGAAKPRAGGGLVLNLRDGVAVTDAVGAAGPSGERWIARWARAGCRGNDAAVDAAGRLWAGTMRYDEATGGGRLYCVEVGDGGAVTVDTVLDAVSISNGIGWSPDGSRMYYNDTPTRRVDVFDVDADSGAVTARRPFVELGADVVGFPDGLTVDADGCVWVALWEGAAVHRYSPDGRLDRVVRVPTSRPTACAFGGRELHDLYVTTARTGLDDAALEREPLAGSVLVLPDAGAGLAGAEFAG
jgi:sugar lactone lactonase YvrE